MKSYICFRCGYGAKQIGHLKDHLEKTKPCPTTYDIRDRMELLEILKDKNNYITNLNIILPLIEKLNLKPIETVAQKPSTQFVMEWHKNHETSSTIRSSGTKITKPIESKKNSSQNLAKSVDSKNGNLANFNEFPGSGTKITKPVQQFPGSGTKITKPIDSKKNSSQIAPEPIESKIENKQYFTNLPNNYTNPIESDTIVINNSDIYRCYRCNRGFNSNQSRLYHEKQCQVIDNHIDNSVNNSNNINSYNTINNNITNNNITNNNNNNNIVIATAPVETAPKLCVFGKEDISYIVKLDKINDYERIARSNPNKVIPTIVQDIYFNKEHPENQTVRIENVHGNLAMIRVGLPDQWEYVDRKATINDMIKYGINAAETGNIDSDNLPKYDALVNNFYSEVNPHYNSTVKAIDTILLINLRKNKRLK